MSYTDENTKIQYISVSGQTAYTVPFTVYQTSDIQVWKNSSELIDLTDYNDVLNVDNEISSITLVVPATTGDVITILRNTEVNRATNFTNNIKISTNSLNTEFNRIYRKLDELGDKQSLKFADYSTASAALILPEPQSNKWLVWNSAQTALVNSTITLSDLGDLSGNLQEDYEEYSAFLSSQTVTHIINLNDEYTELNLALTSTGTFYINEVSAVGQSFIDLFQNSQYAQLSAINTFTNPIISTAPNNLATNSMPITIGENGNRGITGIGTTQLGFIVANEIAAAVGSAGTTLSNTYSIVTREKGDARYMLIGGSAGAVFTETSADAKYWQITKLSSLSQLNNTPGYVSAGQLTAYATSAWASASFVTSAYASATYQPRGNYLTSATQSTYATSAWASASFVTSAYASATYQPRGNYLTSATQSTYATSAWASASFVTSAYANSTYVAQNNIVGGGDIQVRLSGTQVIVSGNAGVGGSGITESSADAKYAQLSATNTFNSPIISTAPNSSSTNDMPITIGENGNRGITGIGTTQLGFIVANDIAATVASAGTTLANTYTIVTREKGDARYQLAGEYVTTSGLNGQIPVATGSNTITYEYINDYISGAVATSSNSINLFPILKSPYAFTITSATVFSAVGTPSIIFRIDNVPITGLNGIGASAGSYNSQNATALNVVSVGSNVSVLVSGAGFSDFRWQISYRRN